MYGDTLVLDINGAPVTNREGIPSDGFQRPPNIDNQDSVSEETVALLLVRNKRLQVVECTPSCKIRVHAVRRGAVASEQGCIFCKASHSIYKCDCPSSTSSATSFSFSRQTCLFWDQY